MSDAADGTDEGASTRITGHPGTANDTSNNPSDALNDGRTNAPNANHYSMARNAWKPNGPVDHATTDTTPELVLTISLFELGIPKESGPAYGTTKEMTWAAFTGLFQQRREGIKNGPNFIPATFRREPDGRIRRTGANLIARTAIALDIEIRKETGEIPPPLATVVSQINAKGWAAIVYTSHSHTPTLPRYRIVLPISRKIDFQLPAVEVIANFLGLSGVLDTSKLGAASLFYLPSAEPAQLAHHQVEIVSGLPIAAEWITERARAVLAEREAEQKRQRDLALEAAAKRREDRIAQGFDPEHSIIEAVRDRMDLGEELIGHGYLPMPGSYHLLLYPESETRVPGVHILTGRDGVERVRGRGAWFDAGRAVLHLGDRLLVDGHSCPLVLPCSTAIYQVALPLSVLHASPLSISEAHQLVEISCNLRWAKPISGTMFAGWIVCAMVCGALRWRPSIWVTGSTGSGKTWLLENILAPLVGPIALQVMSKTSEAGIRQTLNSDALPVIFDEFEREDRAAAARVQGVLDLMRQASSESDKKILKGTQAQTGPRAFRIRSCFAFSSINVGIAHTADESRVTVLALQKPEKASAHSQAVFHDLNDRVATLITPHYAAGLLARSVGLLPVIRENAETFAAAVARRMGTRRLGDQLGTLLAGAYSLHSSHPIDPVQAMEYLERQDWGDVADADQEHDEYRVLSHLTAHRVRLAQGNSAPMEITIGRLISAAFGADERIASDIAGMELRDSGIRVAIEHPSCVWVSNHHPTMTKILVGTPWEAGWSRALSRLPGAESSGKRAIGFGFGHVSKAVWLPLESIDRAGDAN